MLESHRGDDSTTTYKIKIVYSCTYRGKNYQSDRYHFISVATSGTRWKQPVIDRYPTGADRTCFVNPAAPEEAVLDRHLEIGLLWGLFPLPFMLVGGGAIWFGLRGLRGRHLPRQPGRSSLPSASGNGAVANDDTIRWTNRGIPQAASVEPGPVTLRPQGSPWGRLLGCLLFTLFWNGLLSVFLVQVVRSFNRGKPEWFLMLFLLPFVIIGLSGIGLSGYFFLTLFNPRITLDLPSAILALGDSWDVIWRFRGNTHAIRQFSIRLLGEEVATYRRGTNSYTDRETFYEQILFDGSLRFGMTQGECSLLLPDDSMHSFKSDHNAIEWALQVQAEIGLWPNVKEQFPLIVIPRELQRDVG